ncbi:major mite allergen Der p 23-like [Pollicipes pollicipes]|uniref:major mite allergen Der p 23-like n=1 Tax=Pollicipes pollicipes TaxID=41117 RepID=UPI00188502A1|nr:major mite allergen Der p 23-like [Pollicipes pollicipes]
MTGRLVVLLCALAAVVLAGGADPSTTPAPFKCSTEYGLFSDPDDCHSFYECNEFIPFHFTCPDNLGFDDAAHECNYMPSCK